MTNSLSWFSERKASKKKEKESKKVQLAADTTAQVQEPPKKKKKTIVSEQNPQRGRSKGKKMTASSVLSFQPISVGNPVPKQLFAHESSVDSPQGLQKTVQNIVETSVTAKLDAFMEMMATRFPMQSESKKSSKSKLKPSATVATSKDSQSGLNESI